MHQLRIRLMTRDIKATRSKIIVDNLMRHLPILMEVLSQLQTMALDNMMNDHRMGTMTHTHRAI